MFSGIFISNKLFFFVLAFGIFLSDETIKLTIIKKSLHIEILKW